VISRNTVTHEIMKVELASEFKKNMEKSND
jgi:sarcosine oxidase delta subunit